MSVEENLIVLKFIKLENDSVEEEKGMIQNLNKFL